MRGQHGMQGVDGVEVLAAAALAELRAQASGPAVGLAEFAVGRGEAAALGGATASLAKGIERAAASRGFVCGGSVALATQAGARAAAGSVLRRSGPLAVASLAVQTGTLVVQRQQGRISQAQFEQEVKEVAAETAGGLSGAAAGAALGTAIFPGVGTVVGGLLGSLFGGAGARRLVR